MPKDQHVEKVNNGAKSITRGVVNDETIREYIPLLNVGMHVNRLLEDELFMREDVDYILKTGKESAIVDVTNLVGFFNNRVGDTQARIERSNHNHDVNLMNSNMRAGHVNREVTPMIKVRRAHHDIVEYLDEKLGFLQF